jgi:hypothetical protein
MRAIMGTQHPALGVHPIHKLREARAQVAETSPACGPRAEIGGV